MRVATLGSLAAVAPASAGPTITTRSFLLFGKASPTVGDVLTELNRIAMMLPEPSDAVSSLEATAYAAIEDIKALISGMAPDDLAGSYTLEKVVRLNDFVAWRTWRIYKTTLFWPSVGLLGLVGGGAGLLWWLRSR